jgi:hypothetical protein
MSRLPNHPAHSKFHCFNADCFLVTCLVSLEQLMLEFALEIIHVPGLHTCSCVPTVVSPARTNFNINNRKTRGI